MIQMYHVTKSYPGGVEALVDITLHVPRGEFVFLTGASGAGKTTLLKLLFCAEPPTRGQILLNGRNAARLRRAAIPLLRRQIGMVFQDFRLLPRRSVFENVALALEVMGLPRREIRRRASEAVAWVGLEARQAQPAIRTSGGEQQRTAIARALVNEPYLLLADEPTGNLDPDISLEVMELFKRVNARGTTVLVATHNRDLVTRYPFRTVALEKGRLLA
ncbi:MAG: cell division ATP-binding protein FtsE [Deltaproteobacteria bacterium]|nr:cell division ATP-binding protein FtsE [Deltaproteobacteria bacterium]